MVSYKILYLPLWQADKYSVIDVFVRWIITGIWPTTNDMWKLKYAPIAIPMPEKKKIMPFLFLTRKHTQIYFYWKKAYDLNELQLFRQTSQSRKTSGNAYRIYLWWIIHDAYRINADRLKQGEFNA